jgi:hypothetical protein
MDYVVSKGEGMAFDKDQFRELITDVLKEADLFSDSAVELLMLTAAVESNLGTYIKQVKGPALGVFQMEPNTHDDIWQNYLLYKRELKEFVLDYADDAWGARPPTLKYNLAYSILMTRVHYLRVPEALPKATSPEDLALYWKKYYNTHLGKGDVLDAMRKYRKYCT